jgi:hypothetical protein
MKKIFILLVALLFSVNTNALESEGGVGSSSLIDGNIISVTTINENQDNVCYQTEDDSITCVIVEKN